MSIITHGDNKECPEVQSGQWTHCKGHTMKHNEYSIVIHAPYDKDCCKYGTNLKCKNDGSWAIRIVDDRNVPLQYYSNLCEAHLIQVVTTWMVQH